MHGAQKKLIVLCCVSVALLVVLLLFSGENTAESSHSGKSLVIQDAKVSVSPIQIQSSYTKSRKVYGLIESVTQADLGFELSGVINKIMVKEGDVVTTGQILAELDTLRLKAQKGEVTAALKRARADATLASLSNQRISELVEAKLESSQRLDEARANLDAANALVNEVLARGERIDVEIEKSVLRAPFDGQIVTQILDPGTVVNSGDSVFKLLAQGKLEARIGLPSQTPLVLEVGKQYDLQFMQNDISATLSSISQQRNRATRAIDAIFTLDEASTVDTYIMPGDIVSLSVEVDIPTSGAWIPTSALANGVRGLWTVFVVSNVNGEQQIQSRSVQVDYVIGRKAFVSGAIQQDELLVIEGIQRLTPNQRVTNVAVAD
ncbi:efflux RND transporter periplasmic adaptor subunit [Glaciecola sp. MH2013]|nr:efflux RND transporter periplasmic adaptor subunit [Glaciecola sp. MH2013]